MLHIYYYFEDIALIEFIHTGIRTPIFLVKGQYVHRCATRQWSLMDKYFIFCSRVSLYMQQAQPILE